MKLKFISIFSIVIISIFLASWFALKYATYVYAVQKAELIIQNAYNSEVPNTDDDKVTLITTQVHNQFEETEDISSVDSMLALKIRSYVTNRRLPDFLKWNEGAIETIINKGLCDNASRLLSFVLKREGFQSKQWNMVTSKGAHTAVLVSLDDGREVLVDPLFGFTMIDKDQKLSSPNEVLKKIQQSDQIERFLEPLSSKSNYKFYRDFENVNMAGQGEPLYINITVPDFDETIILGRLDNDALDVENDGNAFKLGPYWRYVGHKYDPNWVRVLKAKKPMTVEFILMQEPDNTVMIFEPVPEVEDKKLIWQLNAGEEIRFYDGRSKLSLKRRNSYIGVDQVTFSAVK